MKRPRTSARERSPEERRCEDRRDAIGARAPDPPPVVVPLSMSVAGSRSSERCRMRSTAARSGTGVPVSTKQPVAERFVVIAKRDTPSNRQVTSARSGALGIRLRTGTISPDLLRSLMAPPLYEATLHGPVWASSGGTGEALDRKMCPRVRFRCSGSGAAPISRRAWQPNLKALHQPGC